jgi:hypothetical protein
VPRDEYVLGTMGCVAIVEVAGAPYHSTAPHWPGEDGPDGVRYPYRFPIATLGVIRGLPLAELPDRLRSCFHRSINGGSRPVVTDVAADVADALAQRAQSENWQDLVGRRSAPDIVNVFGARQRSGDRAASIAGRQQDPVKRKAIERHAEDIAVAHYEALGWSVTRKGAPYDLDCNRDGENLRVEVKGTTGGAGEVELTVNEVSSARENPSELFVVSDITAKKSTGADGAVTVTTTGGRVHRFPRWLPAEDDLAPTRFRYRVPREPGETYSSARTCTYTPGPG